MRRGSRTVGFTQRMTTGNQGNGLFIVHAHIAKGGADRRRRRQRFTAMLRPFGVNVDKPHLGGTQRRFCQRFRVTVGEPGFLVAPVHIKIRFPDILTSGTKTEGTEAGILQRHVTGENIQIGPGDFLTVFLLDWPQQTTRLIQTDVIRPGV